MDTFFIAICCGAAIALFSVAAVSLIDECRG